MKGIGICLKGIEDIAKLEVSEILGSEPEVRESIVLFDAGREKIAEVCYRAQSLVKVLEMLAESRAGDFEESVGSVKEALDDVDFGFLKDKTFKVRCKRASEFDFTSQDMAPAIGEMIIEKTGAKVSLDEPDIIIYAYFISETCYLGIDYSGFDLSKRDYKIYPHPSSLNSTIAYALVRMAGDGFILDPFCGSGTIPIEAALYSKGKSPNVHRKEKFMFNKFLDIDFDDNLHDEKMKIFAADHLLNFIRSTRNNAKLAGVDFETTKMDIEWIDTKLDEKSVDAIVSHLPVESKHQDRRAIEKIYKEFFHQAQYAVKDGGKMVLCLMKDELLKENLAGFAMTEERTVWQGQQEMKVLTLRKL